MEEDEDCPAVRDGRYKDQSQKANLSLPSVKLTHVDKDQSFDTYSQLRG